MRADIQNEGRETAKYDSEAVRVKGIIDAALRNEDILECCGPLVICEGGKERQRHLFPEVSLETFGPATSLLYFVVGKNDTYSFISRYEIQPSSQALTTIKFDDSGETTIFKRFSHQHSTGLKIENEDQGYERETDLNDFRFFGAHEVKIRNF